MKRLLCLSLTLAASVFGSFVAYKRFRIPRLDEGSRRVAVLSAASAECTQNRELYWDRVLVLHANSNFLTVKLNEMEDEIPVDLLRDTLPEILRTRMDRSLFLVDNSAGDDYSSFVLEKRLEQLPGVDRICIIDPKHPPSWYPPKPAFGGGSGGAKMALQMLGL